MPKIVHQITPWMLNNLVKKHFIYHEDGYLIWKEILPRNTKSTIGEIAGSISTETKWNKDGSYRKTSRRQIGFYNKIYFQSKLIWLYHHGNPIPAYIDHKDGDTLNDKIENLRAATNTENTANRKRVNSNNTSGFIGVRKRNNNWSARIIYEGKEITLGTFSSKEEAIRAYDKAASEFFKEFAVPNSQRI